jgi:hypothetical protein
MSPWSVDCIFILFRIDALLSLERFIQELGVQSLKGQHIR